jgi:hypothetical protein
VDFGGGVMTLCYDPGRYLGKNQSFFTGKIALTEGSDGVFHAPQNLERAVMESLHAPCTI